MEEPADKSTAVDVRQGPAEGKRVRRRLVQSTLFPHIKKEDGEDQAASQEDDDDWCSNDKKTKKKSPKRRTPQSRAVKKVAVNGKEISREKVDDGDSPVIVKSDFFLKISERRHQKRQQEEQLCVVSPEKNDNCCLSPNSAMKVMKTPQNLKRKANTILEKQQMKDTTPKKNVRNGKRKETLFKRTPSDFVLDGPTLQYVPNLRSEAKMAAEENSRLFAGRPIHPFFSSWKASKRSQEIIDLENSCCSFQRRKLGIPFNPIHVFQTVEDNSTSVDWGHWQFFEGSFLASSLDLGCNSEVFERSVSPLQFDDFPSLCHPSNTSACHNKISPDPCHVSYNKDYGIDRVDSSQPFSSCKGSNAEWRVKFLQKGSCIQPENCLWTDKYHPRKAAQICGNGESVKFICEWLHLWHGKGSQSIKKSCEDERSVVQDSDYSCCQSDADSENIDEESSLKNVLLVMGPVGSGKSAAIYACAEEQGFQVIEVNASDWRNGALVKQRFGEALQSHWNQLIVGGKANSEKQPPAKSSTGISKVTNGSKGEVVELVILSDEQDSQQASGMPINQENGVANYQNKIKTLILFEDVDATLSEDHGFLSTIQQLAVTAKRPMILTANTYNPILPNNFDRFEVSFRMPSLTELLGLGRVICDAEKAEIHPSLINRLVKCCQGDIRKTIMHLQFWCQGGQNLRKGNRSELAYTPLLIDLEAAHQVLPKLIPWSYPSRLAVLVEEEITKSTTIMEDSHSLVEIAVEQDLNEIKIQKNSGMHHGESECLETKKKAMLSLNYSLQAEDDLLSQHEYTSKSSDTSGSPIAFARRNVRRKLEAVLSSDSEEENLVESTPVCFGSAFCNADDKIQGVKCTSPVHCFPVDSCCPSTEQLSCFKGYKAEQNGFKCSETIAFPYMYGVCNSADVSSVPESSFVPETELSDETELISATVSYGPLVCTEADSMDNLSPNLLLVKDGKFCNPVHMNPEMLGTDCDNGKTILHRDLVGDSHVEYVDSAARGYQMLDECSRCDFAGVAKTLEKPRSYRGTNTVQGTWRRLHDCHMDLQQYVKSEQKDASQALELAFGLSNLISEADVLLSECKPHFCDFLEPSTWPGEKSHSYTWYDDQLQISSVVAQHGICFYAKEASTLGSNMDSLDRVDLAWEMLSSSTNSMALGKLLSLHKVMTDSSEMKETISWSSLRRKTHLCFSNICRSVVPSRAYLALQGDAFHEYFSSLSQISRLGSLHLSECVQERKRRRARVPRHYLSSGGFALGPDDISLLSRYNYYQKVSCQSGDSSLG